MKDKEEMSYFSLEVFLKLWYAREKEKRGDENAAQGNMQGEVQKGQM